MTTIQIKKAKEIFKAEYTKARLEDFLTIAIRNKDKLSKKEFDRLVAFSGNKSNPYYSGGFEFFIKRENGRIKLVRFDD